MSNDHEQIRALIHAYAERIDDGDFDGVADLFAHAQVIAGNGMRFEGRDTLRDLWRNSVITYEDGSPCVCHVISNVTIDVDPGEDTASASSYVTVHQALPDFPLQVVAVSRHRDRFEKVDGEWRFRERRDRQVLVGDLRRHMAGAPEPASTLSATRAEARP